MSLTLRISSGAEQQDWSLYDAHVEMLNALGSRNKHALELLLGPDDLEFGASWHVKREELLTAIESLMTSRAHGSGGFQVRAPFLWGDKVTGRGLGGLKIGGTYHVVTCEEDYWLLWTREQYDPETGINSPKRYDTAELVTEDIGVVRVERRKTGKRDVLRLLDDMLTFVRRQRADELTLILG
jgi:hypothetical protein